MTWARGSFAFDMTDISRIEWDGAEYTRVASDIRRGTSYLNDLRIPPANRLEALKNDRKGQHSIRINDQWRVCFVWTKTGPDAVEIIDYH